MGLMFGQIELANARNDKLDPMAVNALVDGGALHLRIPQHVANQLALPDLDRREVTIADGDRVMVPDVGPILIKFSNRQRLVGALVIGEQALPGIIPMKGMDVIINPSRQTLTITPNSPNIASSVVMGLQYAARVGA